MRIVGPIFALLVSLSMAAAVLTYMERQARPEWIHVQGNSDYSADTASDTLQIATGNPDPYLHRYYRESEGWTYNTLPKSSSARRSTASK